MEAQGKKFWFPAKRYGWGWGAPVCWQGWMVLATFVASIAAGVALLKDSHPLRIIAYVLSVSALLTLVCWIKGENPSWRWGKK